MNYLCTLHPKGALHEHAEKMNMQPLSLGTEFNFLLAGYRLYKLIKKYPISLVSLVPTMLEKIICKSSS